MGRIFSQIKVQNEKNFALLGISFKFYFYSVERKPQENICDVKKDFYRFWIFFSLSYERNKRKEKKEEETLCRDGENWINYVFLYFLCPLHISTCSLTLSPLAYEYNTSWILHVIASKNGKGMTFIFNLSHSLIRSFSLLYVFSQDIKRHDQGVYRCRIDFRASQTQSYTYNLSVISEYLFNKTCTYLLRPT